LLRFEAHETEQPPGLNFTADKITPSHSRDRLAGHVLPKWKGSPNEQRSLDLIVSFYLLNLHDEVLELLCSCSSLCISNNRLRISLHTKVIILTGIKAITILVVAVLICAL